MQRRHTTPTFLLILALFLFAAPAHAAITDDLVGHWRFDDGSSTSANDSSSGNNNGTLTNMDGATDWVTGKLGGALDFDGSNDYVNIGSASAFSFPGDFTLSAWINHTSGQIGRVVSRQSDPGDFYHFRALADGRVEFEIHDSATGVFDIFSTTNIDGGWHHITALRTGNVIRLYIDGVEEASETATAGELSTFSSTSSGLLIGSYRSVGEFFRGAVDDVRIYNRALTTDEVETLANLPIPDITTTSLPDGTTGPTTYSQTLEVLGGNGPFAWATTTGNLPPGLSLNSSTGAITGQATATGTYPFTIQVEDDRGENDTQALSITIIIPAILTNSLPNGALNVAYSETLEAAGGTEPYTWALTAGTLPDGLSLNASTGAITGTPTADGTFAFTVEVTDAINGTDDQELSITINEDPIITTTSLSEGTVDTAYTQTLAVAEGTEPFTWSISAGALPTGLSLDGTSGEISGTPTATGTASFTVRVTDDQGITDTQALSITVNAAPVITTTALPDGTEDDTYSQTLAVSGGTASFTWSVSSGSLPAGLSFNTATGEITGIPTTEGIASFTVQVEDANGSTDTQDLSITIDEASRSSSSRGTSIQARVQNLAEQGNAEAAEALKQEWGHLFPNESIAIPATVALGTCPAFTFTRNLRQGDEGEDVRVLQQTLNCLGFTLAASGPGAPGLETNLFRDLTHAAVARFQEAHAAEVLAPLNLAKGTGYFAELSRKEMEELLQNGTNQ